MDPYAFWYWYFASLAAPSAWYRDPWGCPLDAWGRPVDAWRRPLAYTWSCPTFIGQQHPIIRVPVIDEEGGATNLQAIWAMRAPVPSYFFEAHERWQLGDVWLFEDPNGDLYVAPERVVPGSPLAGRRFRTYYTIARPIFSGDRTTSRKPRAVPAPPDSPAPGPTVGWW